MNKLLTPREWQRQAIVEAANLVGTDEYAAKIAEAKRYGMLADELELRHVPAGWRNKREPKLMRVEPPHPSSTELWEQLFTRRAAT
jgi:hypothetical protein